MRHLRVIALQGRGDPNYSCIVVADGLLQIYIATTGGLYPLWYGLDEVRKGYATVGGFPCWTDLVVTTEDRLLGFGHDDEVLVNGVRTEALPPLSMEQGRISTASLALYRHFLRFAGLNQSARSLRKSVESIVAESQLGDLTQSDRELVVRARVEGFVYPLKRLKNIAADEDPRKLERATSIFARLFLLERANYIDLDAPSPFLPAQLLGQAW